MERDRPATARNRYARTAALVAVGCKVNQSELRQWGAALEAAGVTIVPSGAPADLAIVNTCTVTSDGDKTSRKAIRHAVRQASADGAASFVVATGCSASVDPEAVAAIEGVDLVVPNADKDDLVRQLAGLGVVPPLPEQPDRWTHPAERPGWVTLMPALERRARAFVKVQDGCNSHCTYCIVPRARGPQRSRPIDAIVNEIRVLHHLGYREAVLTGVQIGAYGQDWDPGARRVTRGRGPTLADLVGRILAETLMPRIRISSIQPQDWPDGFLDLWQDSRMCRHLHLPLQSGSDGVLRRMARRYRAQDFRQLVERLRGLMPDVAITADLMVGFPGETEAEHRESLALVREIAFAEQHLFRYSARPGTAAARLPDDVPPPVKKRRSDEARALDAELRTAYRRRFLGRTMDVLWEEHAHTAGAAHDGTPIADRVLNGVSAGVGTPDSRMPDGHALAGPTAASGSSRIGVANESTSAASAVWSGLTDTYLRVFAPGDALEGAITPVRLLDLEDDGIRGEIVWTNASSAAS